ncbi:MAG: DUF2586 domain-containing protein [Negativicutes bacterium]|nr:DUF2586 domain-containing protein [Negativicutes bacterium]
MGLPDVTVNISDGGLGILPASSTGILAKVGVSSSGEVNQIIPITDHGQITNAFGTGPLADALADSFMVAGTCTVYAVRAASDIVGTNGAITSTKTGTGTLTVAGEPLDQYDVVVQIIDGGRKNSATFQYSLDKGNTFSGKITVPATGDYLIARTGMTLTFAEGVTDPVDSFLAGDSHVFSTTAPSASVTSINAAIDVLLQTNLTYEGIHIVGPSQPSLWAALSARALEAESKFRYLYIVAEARGPLAAETVDAWATAIIDDADDFADTRVSIVAGRLEISDLLSGRTIERNGAGVYTGRIAQLKVMESAGKVIIGSLSGVVSNRPSGINDGHILALDEARFVTFRQYEGLNGIYITDGRMMAEDISDFRYIELRRVMDKACRNCRMAALRFVQAEASTEGIDALEAFLQQPLNIMIGDKEITAGRISIPKNQDILATSMLKAKIRIQPVGIMRDIELDIGFENPFATGGSGA